MITINTINPHNQLIPLSRLIAASHKTVADHFGFTPESVPSSPAFMTPERLEQSLADKPITFYTALLNGETAGCCAIEDAGNGIYYLERLSVLPEWRNRGVGEALTQHALQKVRQWGGKKVSIAIIGENEPLKLWYKRMGFSENGTKTFAHLPFTVLFMEIIL